MGCHEKAPVRCPCSWLAALHGAPRTLMLMLFDLIVVAVVVELACRGIWREFGWERH